MLTEWQEKFALKENLTQGDFEALEMALSKMPMALLLRKSGSNLSHGAMLRSAIKAGWIISPEVRVMTDEATGQPAYFFDGKDVDKMHPGAVVWLGEKINAKYESVLNDDPKNW